MTHRKGRGKGPSLLPARLPPPSHWDLRRPRCAGSCSQQQWGLESPGSGPQACAGPHCPARPRAVGPSPAASQLSETDNHPHCRKASPPGPPPPRRQQACRNNGVPLQRGCVLTAGLQGLPDQESQPETCCPGRACAASCQQSPGDSPRDGQTCGSRGIPGLGPTSEEPLSPRLGCFSALGSGPPPCSRPPSPTIRALSLVVLGPGGAWTLTVHCWAKVASQDGEGRREGWGRRGRGAPSGKPICSLREDASDGRHGAGSGWACPPWPRPEQKFRPWLGHRGVRRCQMVPPAWSWLRRGGCSRLARCPHLPPPPSSGRSWSWSFLCWMLGTSGPQGTVLPLGAQGSRQEAAERQ